MKQYQFFGIMMILAHIAEMRATTVICFVLFAITLFNIKLFED